MVKKSKKSKSKRVTLRKKYKVLRKVKDHHKKKAKEAKKLGQRKKPAEKDPGIPNAWPFKEQELQALEARRARVLEEIEQKKQAKKERAEKRKLGILEEEEDVAKFARNTASRISEFEKRSQAASFTNGKAARDGSDRAFYKELLKVIEASDVILEVLDARDPLGSRCLDLEKLVHKSGPTKKLVLVLNKIDLIPREVAEKWLKYLREELPTVAFKSNTQQQKGRLGQKAGSKATAATGLLETSECLGAETLLQLLKNYSRNQKLKTSIAVGVVGLPNVGKSSLINSMKRTRAVNVGATPGVTKVLQEIHLDKQVKLLDCPGVVLAKDGDDETAAVLRNSKKIEKLKDPSRPVEEILKLCTAEKLMSIYKIARFASLDEFLRQVATVRGKLKKGGVVDVTAAARIVLKDWNEGKIPYYTLPPAREGDNLESAIVSTLSKEFNVDDVYKDEQSSLIAGLPSLIEKSFLELPSNSPRQMESYDMECEEGGKDSDGEEMEEHVQMDTVESAVTRGRAFLSQNEKLYDEDGILNPRVARAERKRRKKTQRSKKEEGGEDGSDYDFDVDYVEDDAHNSDSEAEGMAGIQ